MVSKQLTLTDSQVRQILKVWNISLASDGAAPVAILAVRDADGDGNEFGVYDDKMYIVTSSQVRVFTANTDPSNWVVGRAQMETGQIVYYRAGKHKLAYPSPRGYAAFRQASNAWFRRRGSGREFSNIAANLHHGGLSGGTSSLACQTVPVERWLEFRELIYDALGVTEKQVLANPFGTGQRFPYLILSRDEVSKALAGTTAVAPVSEPLAPIYSYYLPDGRKIPETQMVVGRGYAPTRATMALLLNVGDPETLKFASAQDGSDDDTEPDLVFVNRSGRRWPIDVLDADVPRTVGLITDMATAAGLTWSVDIAKREVRFSKISVPV